MSTYRPRAVVIGAGIAGLSTALRLHQAGWDVLVAERTPARRSGGYAVVFAGVGYDAAERMGILPELAKRHITPDRMDYMRPDGRTRFSVPGRTVRALVGERSLSLLRGDVEDVLYRAVAAQALGRGSDAVEIRFGTSIAGVDQDPDGVDATLSDSGRTLAVVSLGADRAVAFFGYRTERPMDELADGPQVAPSRAYGDMGWVAPDVLDQLTRAESVYFDTISQIVVDRWSQGRVVLLGDAAWCVTLFAGYGSALDVAGVRLPDQGPVRARRPVQSLAARPTAAPRLLASGLGAAPAPAPAHVLTARTGQAGRVGIRCAGKSGRRGPV